MRSSQFENWSGFKGDARADAAAKAAAKQEFINTDVFLYSDSDQQQLLYRNCSRELIAQKTICGKRVVMFVQLGCGMAQ